MEAMKKHCVTCQGPGFFWLLRLFFLCRMHLQVGTRGRGLWRRHGNQRSGPALTALCLLRRSSSAGTATPATSWTCSASQPACLGEGPGVSPAGGASKVTWGGGTREGEGLTLGHKRCALTLHAGPFTLVNETAEDAATAAPCPPAATMPLHGGGNPWAELGRNES